METKLVCFFLGMKGLMVKRTLSLWPAMLSFAIGQLTSVVNAVVSACFTRVSDCLHCVLQKSLCHRHVCSTTSVQVHTFTNFVVLTASLGVGNLLVSQYCWTQPCGLCVCTVFQLFLPWELLLEIQPSWGLKQDPSVLHAADNTSFSSKRRRFMMCHVYLSLCACLLYY